MKEECFANYDYQGKQLIGSGSNGSRVFKIKSKKDGQYYALKKLLVTNKNKKQYLTETTILKKISHPNIIQYYENFIIKDKLYLILEYAKDGDLRRIINSHKEKNILFEQNELFHYIIQLADSIEYIHGKKILHRDIKPENIFLSDNKIKLGDFGISKELTTSIDFTDTGVGTPFYISPEICNGEKYNYKTDIWSFGCLIYELMTLKRPFTSDSISGLMYNIINNEPPEIDSNFYDNDLINLVKCMMKKNFDLRPDIKEIKNKLEFIRNKNRKNIIIDNINNSIQSNSNNNSNNNSHNNSTVSTSTINSHHNNSGKFRQKIIFLEKDIIKKDNSCDTSKSPNASNALASDLKYNYLHVNKSKLEINKHCNNLKLLKKSDNNNKNEHTKYNELFHGNEFHLTNKKVPCSRINFSNNKYKNDKNDKNIFTKKSDEINLYDIKNKENNNCNSSISNPISMTNYKPRHVKRISVDTIKRRMFDNENEPPQKIKINLNLKNRKDLIKKFLLDKYNEENFGKIEEIFNNENLSIDDKKSKIIDIIGIEEYIKSKKFFKYFLDEK